MRLRRYLSSPSRSVARFALLFVALFASLSGLSAHELSAQQGTLEVQIMDRGTAHPLSGVVVRVRGIARTQFSDLEGIVRFEDLPARSHTLIVEHLGYAPFEGSAQVTVGTVSRIEVLLTPTPLQIAGIVVSGTGQERGLAEAYRPITAISGTELQRALASSLPATLEGVPGFRMQYNGPGAASPSIRGMSGDRVLVLEDGNRTGDLYQTASDHGVSVDPLTARRIEVIRGPAGLLYGANALGGVVNVIRDDVPRSLPSRASGAASAQFESVNRGMAVGAFSVIPLGQAMALRAEINGRALGDTETPAGTLERTDLRSHGGSLGVSWIDPEGGFVGVSLRLHDSRYGVPGSFNGVLIPGGHTGGVEIDIHRLSGRLRGEKTGPFVGGFFSALEGDAALNRYRHDEIEGQIDGRTVLGARFLQTSGEASLLARHDHTLHDHPLTPLRSEGTLGVGFRFRRLEAGGVSPGSRSGDDVTASLFGFEEFARGSWRLQLGLRFDAERRAPASLEPIRVRTREREIVKPVRDRSFYGVSASVAALRALSEGWVVGVSAARSNRAPSLEELFSNGPHLADFSFDIGSPELASEVGLGLDVFLRGTRPTLDLEFALFLNRVDGYLHYRQTGETVRVLRDGVDPRVTPVYEAYGDNALFHGAEGRVQWEALPGLVLDGTASVTQASRRADDDPLPFIPPLGGRAEARYEGTWVRGPGIPSSTWFVAFGVKGATAQDRVPRPVRIGASEETPQAPTPGHGILTAGVGGRITLGARTHALTLQAENLTNREWRDHLSRIKDIAPQPGRNVHLTWRVLF